MDGLGHVVLSGFENARRFTPGTFTNTLFGTEGALRAPEIGEHEGYNESVDVWALGVRGNSCATASYRHNYYYSTNLSLRYSPTSC